MKNSSALGLNEGVVNAKNPTKFKMAAYFCVVCKRKVEYV